MLPSTATIATVQTLLAMCFGSANLTFVPSHALSPVVPRQIGEEGQVHVFSAKHNKWHPFKFDRVRGVLWPASAGQLIYLQSLL